MTTEYAFDAIPVGVLWMLIIFGAIGIYEVGFRVGRWWQEHTPDEKEGSTGLMVGSPPAKATMGTYCSPIWSTVVSPSTIPPQLMSISASWRCHSRLLVASFIEGTGAQP